MTLTTIGAPLYRSVDSILKRGVERQPLAAAPTAPALPPAHENLRGPDYYH